MSLFPLTQYDFPNVSNYDSDLREVLKVLFQIANEMEDFEAVNKITFAGEWDITKQYSPWTIVSGDDNNGYLSIKPVPKGIELDNTDYWLLIANYSALYADLQNRIIALEDSVSSLEDSVSSLEDSVSTLDSKTETLTTRNNVNGGGAAVFVGDSYSDTATGYTHALPYYINEIMNFSRYINKAVAGAGFVNGSGTNQNFSGQLDLAINEMTLEERLEVSYVFALGGQNDSGHPVADLQTWLANFITKAKTNFPNAKVVILPLWYNRALSADNVLRYQIIYNTALFKECITDTMSWAYMINTTVSFMLDGVHPLETSLPYLASCIATSLKGGNAISPADGYGVATFLTDSLDITWAVKSSYVDTARNVHIKYIATVGATGITANTPIIKVNDVYKPSHVIYSKIDSLDGAYHNMMQLNTNGDYFTANTINAGIYIVDLSYSLYSDNA